MELRNPARVLFDKSGSCRQPLAVGRLLQKVADFSDALTLKTRVALLVAVMIIAGIWGLALTIAFALEHDLADSQSASLSAAVANVAEDLDRDVQLHITALNRLATSFTHDILADQARLDRALDQFADSSVIVPAACVVTDVNGIVMARYPEHAAKIGASVADAQYFRDVMASGRPVVGAPVAAGADDNRPAVPIAVPLRDGAGATGGALVGFIVLSDPDIFGQLEHAKIGRSGFLVLMSPRDRIRLGASDNYRSELLKPLPPHGVNPLLDRRLYEGFEDPGITMSSYGVRVLTVSRNMPGSGWMLLGGVPTEEIFAPITRLKRQVYLAALLISLVVAAVLRFVLSRQLAALAQAGTAMRRMTDGEAPLAPIPVRRHDEIGELISNFNALVAERMRLEDSLRESKNRIEGIYRSVGDGIITIDEAQRIVMFNSAAEQIFGYSAAEMIGKTLAALIPDSYRAQHEDHVRRFGETGESKRTMGRYGLIYGVRASGEVFPIEATVSRSGTSSDQLYTVILRDVTERRKAEQAREQLTRQLELLTERLATVQDDERRKIAYELHEGVGQELTTLQMYVQILGNQGKGEVDAHRQEALAVIAHAIERVRKLVQDLDPVELENLGLYAAIRRQCNRQATVGRWTMHIDAVKPDARAPRAIERACFHVLDEGLTNILRHARATEVWVEFHQDAEQLELRICDDGVGFDRDAVRETNQRARLGLLAMEQRVTQQGGQLEITSSPGAGTEIHVVFPLAAAAQVV